MKRSSGLRPALRASTALVLIASLAAGPALAQSTWIGAGADWSTGANWSPAGIPSSSETAIFTNNGAPTELSTSANTQIGTLNFDAGAPGYTITLGNDFTVNTGVINSSGVNQTIATGGSNTIFLNGATGSSVTYNLTAGGGIQVYNSAGGDSAYVLGSGRLSVVSGGGSFAIGSLESTGGSVDNYTGAALAFVIGGLGTSTTFGGTFTQASGTVSIEKVGAGTLILTGNNTYSGLTTITGGTLQIGAGGTTGTLGTNGVVNNAALVFNRSDDITIGNAISGSGTLTQAGGGRLTLGADNSYEGGTFLNAGAIAVSSDARLGATTGGLTFNGGTLVTTASFTSARSITLNSGNGTFAPEVSTTLTLTGPVSGAGALIMSGAGRLELTSGNTYQLGTGITSGVLAIAADSALGHAAGVLQMTGGALVTTADISMTRSLGLLNETAALRPDLGTTLTLSGVISDLGPPAGFVMDGAGTLVLAGSNTYSGTTTISSGTLQVGAGVGGGATGTLGSGNVVNNAALVFNRTGTLTVANVISGTGTVTQAGTGTTVLTGDNTYSGTTTISAGTLRIGDGGSSGTLGTGSVVNNGVLAFDRDFLVVANPISGTGQVRQASTGITYLTGALSHTGGTFVDQGFLVLGDTGSPVTLPGNATVAADAVMFVFNGSLGSGVVTNNGSLGVFGNSTAGSATIHNSDSLSGGLYFADNASAGTATITNLGAMEFSGNSTAANATIYNSCCLAFTGSSTAANATIVNYAAGNIDFVDSATAGAASIRNFGQISFWDNASGGTASYLGEAGSTLDFSAMMAAGTTLGSLAGTGAVNLGSIMLTVGGNGTSTTFAGVIADGGLSGGTGAGLTKEGTGNLILTGISTYTGPTFVNAGRLSVNGSIASSSSVTVASGGTLGGTGSLPGVIVQSGGTLAPGNSIGTIGIAGNLTLAPGSTTQIEVQGPLIDRINVTGTAALGGTLQLLAQGGSYTFNAPYTIVQAGAVTGNFAAVNATGSFGAGVTSNVSTTATQALLTLTPAPLVPIITPPAVPDAPAPVPPVVKSAPVIGPRGTPNQVSVAAGLDRAVAGGADVSAFFPLYNLPAAALPRGLDQVSGQVHAVAMGMHAQPAYQFLGAILDPRRSVALGDGADGAAPRYAVWASGFGGGARMGASGNPGTYAATASGGGVAVGADVRLSAQVVAGMALAGSGAMTRLSDSMGRAETSQIQGALYGTGSFGALQLSAAVAYGGMDVTTRRTVPFLGTGDLRGRYTANGVSTRLEAGWRMEHVLPRVVLTPSLAFQGSWYETPSFTETGVGGPAAAALAVSGRNQGQSRMELSVRADMALTPTLSGFGRVGWAAYLQRDAGMAARFIGLANSGFTLGGARPDANAALLSGGVDWRLNASTTVTARVDSELASNSYAVNGTARIRYEF